MPRSPADNQQLKDARRTEILRAASRVFAKKGLAAAKISDIAREAGLSHGLVYHYFDTKDAVFSAILDEKLEHMRAAMAADEALPGTNLDRIRASVSRWLERTLAEPEMGLMIAQAMLSGSMCESAKENLARHAEWSFQTSVARIRDAQSRGEIGSHASPEELATTLLCLMRGISLTALPGADLGLVPPSADTVIRLVLPGSVLAQIDGEPQALPAVRGGATPRAARVRSLPPKSPPKKKNASTTSGAPAAQKSTDKKMERKVSR